jgi:hypothetical protein
MKKLKKILFQRKKLVLLLIIAFVASFLIYEVYKINDYKFRSLAPKSEGLFVDTGGKKKTTHSSED